MTCANNTGTEAGTQQGPSDGSGADAGGTRLRAGQLTAETEIIWLVPTDGLDYVREHLDITKRRSGKPPYHGLGRLVGYANLDPATTATRDSGRYDRRTFWLLPTDRSESDDSPYATYAPLEAVDPRTVAPGQPGRLTERAWGSPLPPHRHAPPHREHGSPNAGRHTSARRDSTPTGQLRDRSPADPPADPPGGIRPPTG
ncbi:DUF6009 family protein [Streptomyces goshikiensis]|uniref:DUF6009 family protein n=1 Tax=Streptomyces goshikiensis TaxID=1942 RepID=UPI0036C9493C